MPLSIAEELLYTSVHLEAVGPDGRADATGLLFNFNIDGQECSTIVTNKHALEDATQVIVTFHVATADGSASTGTFRRVTIDFNDGGVAYHPDADIDLCAISLDLNAVAGTDNVRIFNRFAHAGMIPDQVDWDNMDAFEELVMIGCPNGLSDTVNHLPIGRRGMSASHPSYDFEGKPEFLIDAACFPGSSGSPVYLIDRVGSHDKLTATLDISKRRRMLVGILYAGPMITNEGKVLKRKKFVSWESMMHLGYVIKSRELLTLRDELERKSKTQ